MVIKLSTTNYLKVWLLFILISSFVLSNTVKGTTPAFIFSIISFLFTYLTTGTKKKKFYQLLFALISIYIIILILSQIFLSIFDIPNYSDLVLISNDDRTIFRNSLFTQSLYIFCSWFTFAFVTIYYKPNIHLKYLVWALVTFISYGFYLWVYYLLFGSNGDFISNREFADGLIMPAQFQQIVLSGLSFGRFVSLTMEPSMYVFTILPYYVYLLNLGYKKISFLILCSLILTFSGTFIFGLIAYTFTLIVITRQKQYIIYASALFAVVIFTYLFIGPVKSGINEIVISKLLQESDSGLDRFQSLYKHMSFFFDLPIPLMLFGVGFGFIRSPEFFSTLLVNSGIIGFTLFFILFLYPVYKLSNNDKEDIGLKCALVLVAFMLITSVSEYSYPSIWLLLGIAYNRLQNRKDSSAVN